MLISSACSKAYTCLLSLTADQELTLRARACPTMPCDTALASRASSRPRPRMWECAPIRSMRVRSLTVPSTLTSPMLLLRAWYFSRHFQRRMVRLTTKTVIYVDTLRQKEYQIRILEVDKFNLSKGLQ
eukprot:1140994-Pelagomonas_calceolata.AAC.1